MKKVLLCVIAAALIACTFSSCTTMKRDCQGKKHYRLNNGIYL